jgi:predicted nucleic acid-binding protein
MTGPIFVDSNVLVYSRDSTEPLKQKQAMAWMAELWATRNGRLSFQVLQEFYVIVTAKLKPGLNREAARRDIRSLLSWHPVTTDERVVEGAWVIQDRYKLSWWDSLIVSAAQVANCRFLLSEDLQPGQDLGGVQIIDPFENSPQDLAS